MEEKLTTIQKVCDEVERFRRLESEVEFDDEWMRDLLHDVPLNLCVVRLICADDEVLLERLHGVDLPIVLFLCHVDFAEGAATHDLQQLEVIDRLRTRAAL